ncbi:proline utilization trans-activator [Paraphoma chrysanthemicola]|nr:proline utilization trans-activator [Paraphoma chrysanthemicola]
MACQRCNRKKIKCSGGDAVHNAPCRNCRSAHAQCVYPMRHKSVTVSESYLRSLEQAVSRSAASPTVPPSYSGNLPTVNPQEPMLGAQSSSKRFIENTTGDAFFSQLKGLTTNTSDINENEEHNGNETRSTPPELGSISAYEYIALPSDQPAINLTLKLPPYPYAIHLVNQFETYMGYEYHWYLRKAFRERLETTYNHPKSEVAKERSWLCQLLVVFALGETYNSRLAPSIELGPSDSSEPAPPSMHSSPPPPGLGFFNEAVSLFKTPFEEVATEHIEVLNLMAFYSYSLGRRKSAYAYSGLAIRFASILMLQMPDMRHIATEIECEHRKRLWWTTYQLDAMTGYELGLNSTYDLGELEAKIGLPSEANMSPEQQLEFAPAQILTAHALLVSIRARILSIPSIEIAAGTHSQHVIATLTSSIAVIDEWYASLPQSYRFDFSNGLPDALTEMSEYRSLASLFLRYHHCFIIVLRPYLLQFLSSALQSAACKIDQSTVDYVCSRCIQSARYNLKIMQGLRQRDKIAKFGFWESLHLFSSIKVYLMVNLVTVARPFSIVYDNPDDEGLYRSSKRLLSEMVSVGNISSRKHYDQIEELERLRALIVANMQVHTSGGAQVPNFDIDIDEWLSMLAASPNVDMYPI